jgi:hypothetical protein
MIMVPVPPNVLAEPRPSAASEPKTRALSTLLTHKIPDRAVSRIWRAFLQPHRQQTVAAAAFTPTIPARRGSIFNRR